MSHSIQISEKSAELLAQQAAEHGLSLEAWIEELALEKANAAASVQPPMRSGRSLVEQMRELRSQVKPDPEGWTVQDYIEHGRR